MINNNKQDNSDSKGAGEETPLYLTSDSTLQTTEEHKHDQSIDPRKDNTIAVSNDDLRETETDRIRGEAMDEKSGSSEGDNS
jgi:hypothetical protein